MTADRLSARLRSVVDQLPLQDGMRVLEIGCGPGAAAREIARRVGQRGVVLGIDRSSTAIASARDGAERWELDDRLSFRCHTIEDFALAEGEAGYDLAVAVRVGVLDGRHAAGRAWDRIREALAPEGRVFVGGDRVREVDIR